jgi:outer membrane receptor protein involved in Fe transport
MNSIIRFAASTLALSNTLPALAQETEDATDDAIVVTGDGLDSAPSESAYAVTELDRDLIISSGSGRIEDVLENVAGFQQFRRSDSRSSNPSAQGVTLRALGGNATSRALVLLDGVPVSDPFFGYVPLSSIAPERLDSIRVTRGGGSGPFGAGALAGTIELNSADADTIGTLSGRFLINDREETEASASASTKLGQGFVSLSGRWDRGQGFFTTPENQRVPATARAGFDSWSVGLRAVAPLNATTELQVRGLVYDDARTLRFAGADSTSEGQDASIRLVGRGDWQFDALAYVQARNFSNVVISSTRFVRVLDQRDTPSTGLGGKIELRPPVGGGHTLRIGADYRQSEGELQEESYSAFTGALRERRRAGGTNSDLGLFIEDDWRAGPLLLTGGIRADHTRIADGFFRARDASGAVVSETIAADRSEWSLSWRAGAAVELGQGVTLRGAAYTGLRLPTLNELYRPFVVFPVVTQANAALENERLEGFELGFDWQPSEAVSIALTAFDNEVENAIANATLAPNLRQRQNLPAISAQGIEANLSLNLGDVRILGSLAYTDAEVVGSGASLALDGNRPPQTPELAGSLTLAWQPKEGWQLSTTVRHVSEQFESDQETNVLPAATTLDAFVQIPLRKGVSVIARGENLFDEQIVTRNAGGVLDLGVPRTLWLGVGLDL